MGELLHLLLGHLQALMVHHLLLLQLELSSPQQEEKLDPLPRMALHHHSHQQQNPLLLP
jgi:hypothetical protein